MGAVGGLLGVNGGVSGTGISGPNGAPIVNAVNQGDVNSANKNQYDILKQLGQQGGIGNQNDVYGQSQALYKALQQAKGLQNQSGALQSEQALRGQQQGLADQYQAVANGQGPNPAMAALNNATGKNISNQAALMAGQRGANANIGLIARQAAMAGGNLQQQAAGQAAEMQANQSLAAMQGLGAQQNAIGGTNMNIAGIAGQQLAAQQAQQQALSGMAANQAANQIGAGNQYQQNILNSINAQNSANVGSQNSINAANASAAGQGMANQGSMIGGILQAAGAGGAMAGGKAHGGYIEAVPMATGGSVPMAPVSSFGQFLQSWQSGNGVNPNPGTADPGSIITPKSNKQLGDGAQKLAGALQSRSGQISTGATAVTAGPDAGAMPMTMVAAKGGLAQTGGHVSAKNPAQKAVKSGDSYANDKVPAMLSEGEIVIPRSVLQSKDPVQNAAKFVQNVLAKRR